MSSAPVLYLTIDGGDDGLDSLTSLQDLKQFQGTEPENSESRQLNEQQARDLLCEETFTVLRALLQQKGMSRGKLQGQTGLDRSTVQSVMDELIKHGIAKKETTTGVYYLPYSNIHLNIDRDDIPNGKLA